MNDLNSDEQQAESRMGRFMLYGGWLMALAVLTLIFSDFEISRNNPNRDLPTSGEAEVVLKKNRYGHYVFTGTANGKEVEFLLDTGATNVVFTEAQAEKLGLKKGTRYRTNTANGESWSYSTRVDVLTIGSIKLYDVQASIAPNLEIEALLGMSALGDLDWSQSGDQLTIRRRQQ